MWRENITNPFPCFSLLTKERISCLLLMGVWSHFPVSPPFTILILKNPNSVISINVFISTSVGLPLRKQAFRKMHKRKMKRKRFSVEAKTFDLVLSHSRNRENLQSTWPRCHVDHGVSKCLQDSIDSPSTGKGFWREERVVAVERKENQKGYTWWLEPVAPEGGVRNYLFPCGERRLEKEPDELAGLDKRQV